MPDTSSLTPPFANVVRHAALSGGAPCPLPDENALELDLLRRAVANDWGPRDAYERHWAGELVAAMHRQQLLRAIELKALAATEAESPTDAAVQRLLAFARYGARLDRDLGAALRALRVLRNRPDAWIEEKQKSTFEPKSRTAASPRTPEPERPAATAARTSEPERLAATAHPFPPTPRTCEPDAPIPPPLNRHERRRLEALQRQAGRRAA